MGGHGCYAAAADLSVKGHQVRLWRRDEVAFRPVLEEQSLELKDVRGARKVNLALASTDMASVIKDVSLILIPLPAFSQASLAKALAPIFRTTKSFFYRQERLVVM